MKLWLQFWLWIALVAVCAKSWAQIEVSPANGGNKLCVGSSSYTVLGNIRIAEQQNNDISSGSAKTIVLVCPDDFEFDASSSISLSFNSGADLSSVGFSINSDSLVLTLDIASTSAKDTLTIAGLAVKAINQNSGSNIHLGKSTTASLNGVDSTTNFGTLVGNALPNGTPSITTLITEFCFYETKELQASGANTGEEYVWYKDNVIIPGENTDVLTVTANGFYKVAIKNTLSGCTGPASAAKKVTIHPQVKADAGPDKTICQGNTVSIGSDTATASGGYGFFSVEWRAGSNPTVISRSTNPTVKPGATTTYQVTVTDMSGCQATDQVTVTVKDTAKIKFKSTFQSSFSPNSSEYNLETGLLESVTPGGGTYYYLGKGVIKKTSDQKYYFYPNIAGNGTHTISYYHTAGNGCISRKDTTVIVQDSLVSGVDSVYCHNANPDKIFFDPTKLGGSFTFDYLAIDYKGTYYTDTSYLKRDIGFDSYTFKPSVFFNQVGEGDFSIAVFAKYLSIPVLFADKAALSKINPAPAAPTINLASAYCHDDAEQIISITSPGYTLISASSTDSSVIFSGGNYRFVPNLVSINAGDTAKFVNITVNYLFQGCSSSSVYQVKVNKTPDSPSAADLNLCVGNTVTAITASDVLPGAQVYWYKSDSVLHIGKFFDLGKFISTSSQGIYSFCVAQKTSQGCLSPKDTFYVYVNDTAIVSINNGNDAKYCKNQLPFVLNYEENSLDSGIHSFFIDGNPIPTLQFDPDTLSVGEHKIRYEFTNLTTGCQSRTEQKLTIYPVSVVSFDSLPETVCASSVPFRIKPPKSNLAGSFTIFSPNYPGYLQFTADKVLFVPPYSVSATEYVVIGCNFYTNAGSCLTTITDTIKVEPLPHPKPYTLRNTITVGNIKIYCKSDALDTIKLQTPLTAGDTGYYVFYNGGDMFKDLGNGVATIDPSKSPDDPLLTPYLEFIQINAAGCQDTGYLFFVINPIPKPFISVPANKFTYCYEDDSVIITGNADVSGNGTFSGRGITDLGGNKASFYPRLAAMQAGINAQSSDSSTHVITYHFTSLEGCTDSTKIVLKVLPNPTADFLIRDTAFCINEPAATLTPVNSKGLPLSVKFSGRGVITYADGRSVFFPRLAAQSVSDTITDTKPQTPTTHDIVAEFTTHSGKCVDTKVRNITVYPLPLPDIEGEKAEYCIDGEPELLTGVPALTAQTKGVFTGPGISDSLNGKAFFNPAQAGLGLHEIRYTYTNEKGCENSKTIFVRVIDRPALSIAIPNNKTTFCFEDDSVLLRGSSSQPRLGSVAGYFIGRGIRNIGSDSAIFSPRRAAIEAGLTIDSSQSSTHDIAYVFTNYLGCVDTAYAKMTVLPMPDADFEAAGKTVNSFCIDEPATRLREINRKHLPLSSVVFEGDGVSIINGEYFFTPRSAAAAKGIKSDTTQITTTHTIRVTFTTAAGNCRHSRTKVFTVNPLPVVSLQSLKKEYCFGEAPDTIYGIPAVTSGTTGVFSALSGLTDLGDGRAVFNPQVSGAGSRTIRYTYTNSNGCTYFKDTTIIVNPLPTVSFSGFNAQRSYCFDSDSVLLTGTPTDSRGIFKGNGIRNNGDGTAWFNPRAAATAIGRKPTDPPSTHRITWIYTDTKGCIDSAVQHVQVDSLPVMGLSLSNGSAIDSHYCYNAPAITLKGTPSPIGGGRGVFSGRGVIDNNNGTATFSPKNAALALGRGELDSASTHTVTYTFTDAKGCVNSISQNIRVEPLPTLSFVTPKNEYCFDEAPDTILATPAGASGRFFIADAANRNLLLAPTAKNGLLDLGNGRAVFYPDSAALRAGTTRTGIPTNHVIFYRFTNAAGCDSTIAHTVLVKPLPKPDIIAGKREYCYDDIPDTLEGRPSVVASTKGIFTGLGITDLGNGRAVFSPKAAADAAGNGLPVDITVRYTFANTEDCTNFVETSFKILPLPRAYFSAPKDGVPPLPAGEDWPDSVCFNTAAFKIVTDSTSPLRSFFYRIETLKSDSTFATGRGLSTDGFFLANLAGVGLHRITLNYIHQNGCDSSFSRLIRVSPEPKAEFRVLSQCDGAEALIEDVSSVAFPGVIKERRWDFGYSYNDTIATEVITDGRTTISHKFKRGPGDYNIQLTVETTDGCLNTTRQRIKIGAIPVANFDFTNQCDGEQTRFHSRSTVEFSNLIRYQWDFDALDSNNTLITSSGRDTFFVFPKPGRYLVRHLVTSTEGCQKDTTIEVIIYPVVKSFPYVESFEDGNAGWSAYGTINSWQLGVLGDSIIKKASHGIQAWATNLTGNADSLERSFVESPCFDLTALRRPMISLDIFSSNVEQADGANLQYTIDNGKTWQLVGSESDPYNWYNPEATPISSLPGGALYGWSGGHGLPNNRWKTARNYLDFLKGQSSVRFRIAYASSALLRTKGFAFDNIYIGERKRTVLVEQFRNLHEGNRENLIAQFGYALVRQYSDIATDTVYDAVGLTYHIETSEKAGDSLFAANPQDPGARAFFYGINQAGRFVIDGQIIPQSLGQPERLPISRANIELKALEDNDFGLSLEFLPNPDGELKAKILITANRIFALPREITLYVAAIERVIQVSPNLQFEWELRKMLPDAAGTIFKRSWQIGDTASVIVSWPVRRAVNPDTIGIIAFLQNTQTGDPEYHQVYQAIYKEPAFRPRIITGMVPEELSRLALFPNPASQTAYVVFDAPANADYDWRLTNPLGQVVRSGKAERGRNGFEVSVIGLPAGVYIINVGGASLKLMIEQ